MIPTFDCWMHELQIFPVKVWGQEDSEADRTMCAQKCSEAESYVAFNYPSTEFAKLAVWDPQVTI
jgi:hypothetical protein